MGTYRMEYVGHDDDIANVAVRAMGWDNHTDFIADVGENVYGLWFPLSIREFPHVRGMDIMITVICIVNNRMYDGECPAIATSYGVYVDVDAYTDATS